MNIRFNIKPMHHHNQVRIQRFIDNFRKPAIFILNTEINFNILQKEIKIKEETIAEAVKADRKGMVKPLKDEIKVLIEFLPSELTKKELTEEINKVISELNATTIKQMGLVMKTVIENVQGRASNDKISKIVRNLLSPK